MLAWLDFVLYNPDRPGGYLVLLIDSYGWIGLQFRSIQLDAKFQMWMWSTTILACMSSGRTTIRILIRIGDRQVEGQVLFLACSHGEYGQLHMLMLFFLIFVRWDSSSSYDGLLWASDRCDLFRPLIIVGGHHKQQTLSADWIFYADPCLMADATWFMGWIMVMFTCVPSCFRYDLGATQVFPSDDSSYTDTYWKKYPWDGLIVFGLVFFVAGRPSVIRMYFVFDTAMQLARFLMDCLVLASFYYSSDSVDTIYRWSWPRYWHTVLFLHSYLILVQRRLKW